ncbi:MAG: 16S rRNA (guanine(966)-N(2))-methyltransferase RsmD [Micrococcales bacterium]|nr:16S rRNA (guanine(966)-N(2))-methyltransferase RsmD [Micrococcales bacterium]
MTRIIGGAAKGRVLQVPKKGTRPTSDMVREALFSLLESQWGSLAGLAVLDLYAGSGALGLEAISRGASRAVLVEANRQAAAAAQNNQLQVLRGATAPVPTVKVIRAKVETWLAAHWPGERFDLVFLDPPYQLTSQALDQVLAALANSSLLANQASVVVERSSRTEPPTWPASWQVQEQRNYGETTIHLACAE